MIQDHTSERTLDTFRSWRAALGDAAFIEMIKTTATLMRGRQGNRYGNYDTATGGQATYGQAAFRAVKERVFEVLFEGASQVVRERRFSSEWHPEDEQRGVHKGTRSGAITSPAICWGSAQIEPGLYRDQMYHWPAQKAPEWAEMLFETHNFGEISLKYGDRDALGTLKEVVGAHQYLAAEAMGWGYWEDDQRRYAAQDRGCPTGLEISYWDPYYRPKTEEPLRAFASESYPVTTAGEAVIEALKALATEGDAALIWPKGVEDGDGISEVFDRALFWEKEA